MFLDSLSKSPGCLPDIRFAPICLAFPVVDNIFLLVSGILSLGCISIDLRVFTPLKQTCIAVYLNTFLKDSLRPENKELKQRIVSLVHFLCLGG